MHWLHLKAWTHACRHHLTKHIAPSRIFQLQQASVQAKSNPIIMSALGNFKPVEEKPRKPRTATLDAKPLARTSGWHRAASGDGSGEGVRGLSRPLRAHPVCRVHSCHHGGWRQGRCGGAGPRCQRQRLDVCWPVCAPASRRGGWQSPARRPLPPLLAAERSEEHGPDLLSQSHSSR